MTKGEDAAWYYIHQNNKGVYTTQKDAAQHFKIRELAVRVALRKIKKELGLKTGEVLF